MTENHTRVNESPSSKMAAIIFSYQNKKATLGIIGLGYVGMPLSLAASRAGFKVIGFDINSERVERINRGEVVI